MRGVADSEIDMLKQKIKTLERENQLLKDIIDNIHESVFVTDEADKVIIYNHETEKIEGMKREDVLGKTELEVYTSPEYFFYKEVVCKVKKTGKPVIEQPYQYALPNGRKINMIFSTFPFAHEGKIAAVYTIARNMNQIADFLATTLEMQKKFMKEEKSHLVGAKYFLEDIVGDNHKITETVSLARKIASNCSPVLIVGDTGTGKELFAHGIHNASLYSEGPLVPVNCAAIPETLLESILLGTVKGAFTGAVESPGLFEQAEGGTIFLDEINSMPAQLQAKLLRVLQDKVVRRIGSKEEIPVNCRIISAINKDPFAAVNEKLIRSDLFYRLAAVTINIPPLRERKDDIKIFALHFIEKFNIKFGLFIKVISDDLINVLQQYNWPGNVRELENVIEGAMNLVKIGEETLEPDHLPEYYKRRLLKAGENTASINIEGGTLNSALLEIEIKKIQDTLRKNKGNISKTAQELGISRQNLHYKIRTFGIQK